MSETTKTPRLHAEMASRYMADDSLKCWLWNGDEWELAASPMWYAESIYHVGHEKPTAPPKRKVTMAGITFDAPETEAPKVGMKYWLIDIDRANSMVWSGSPVEQRWLAAGLAHLDYENARLHTQALIKLNRQLCGMGELLRKEDSND